ncbi:hypothetical protein Tco_0693424 [Tanacetum coccineum]
MGTSTAQVILFGTIPTTIPLTTPTIDLPVIHDDTLLTPTISPTMPPVAPTIQYASPFIDTDSFDSDTPDSPPSPVVLVLPGQPIPIGRPYHSSSRHSSSGYAISETSCDSPTATSERPSRKICRSPSVPISLPVRGALSPVCADLSPPPKSIRDSDLVTNLEVSLEDGYELYVPREVGLGVDVEDSYEPYTEPAIDYDILVDIDECIAYADAIRARGMDDRDVVKTEAEEEVDSRERHSDGAVEVTYKTLGGLVQRFHDQAMEIPVHRIQRDNTRLRGMLDVESQRVDRLQRGLLRAQRELRQIRRFRYYDRVRLGRLNACARRHLDAINELIAKHVDEALKAYDAARNPIIEAKIKNDQQDDHVKENVNHGNGNRNGNSLNFKRTEGVVGLTRWFEKMETVFHISNCPPRYQKALMKLMTELTLLCINMVPEEDDKVEKYIGGLLYSIQWNVIVVEPVRLQDAICIANNLMDQKLKGYAIKNAENKRRFDSNPRDN